MTAFEKIRTLSPLDRRIGTFVGTVVHPMRRQGRFDAGTSGQQGLGGGAVAHYQITGTSLLLTIDATGPVEMLLSVTVVDEAAHAASAQRCVHYEPPCSRHGRLTPTLVGLPQRLVDELRCRRGRDARTRHQVNGCQSMSGRSSGDFYGPSSSSSSCRSFSGWK
ncbi:hypothetical protein H7H78_14635 [Mycobacterium shinjukuense]|uniref:Uncharacterized protein n=1 Tax=Mycobacterium shinjukuense TaxID=398694 RepID=A0A7I7MLG1_9MYCO|nr:hypothetical protein [Mycobacterium shinjukuense]MCV6986615.1 hypothetical protein [Mycobacterium shinjukuense]ORB61535.1 hypothetical protein BST45_19860 [Mycobacterium shinjukuense]BBX72985.1 hypothetical protein MSHI_08910 [Mycobacterium shinjukuense]